jgi:hypothetical protein
MADDAEASKPLESPSLEQDPKISKWTEARKRLMAFFDREFPYDTPSHVRRVEINLRDDVDMKHEGTTRRFNMRVTRYWTGHFQSSVDIGEDYDDASTIGEFLQLLKELNSDLVAGPATAAAAAAAAAGTKESPLELLNAFATALIDKKPATGKDAWMMGDSADLVAAGVALPGPKNVKRARLAFHNSAYAGGNCEFVLWKATRWTPYYCFHS